LLPGPEPEPEAVSLVPRDDVQVQVRYRLADDVVDEDHRTVRAEAVLDPALQPLGGAEELGHLVGGQVTEQLHLQFRHQQGMTAEQRPVIEERDQPFRLQDDGRRRLAADDGAEHTRCWHQP